MKIAVVKEIKDQENRVALTPSGAAALVQAGHVVHVEAGAGLGSGFPDIAYQAAGARVVSRGEVWDAELVVKVKEPLEAEYPQLNGQMVFTYLHLAGVSKSLTEALLQARVTAVAYETVQDSAGKLPLLAPMSAVAGTMAPVIGAYYLAKFNGGKGMLLGEVLGQRYGKVVIIGDAPDEKLGLLALGFGARTALHRQHVLLADFCPRRGGKPVLGGALPPGRRRRAAPGCRGRGSGGRRPARSRRARPCPPPRGRSPPARRFPGRS